MLAIRYAGAIPKGLELHESKTPSLALEGLGDIELDFVGSFLQIDFDGLAHPIELFVGVGELFFWLGPSIEMECVLPWLVPLQRGEYLDAIDKEPSLVFPFALWTYTS